MALSMMGFIKVHAEQPKPSVLLPVHEMPMVEADEASSVLTFTTDNTEISEEEFFNTDSSFNAGGYLNYPFQLKYQMDSTNYMNVLNYIKGIMPAIMNMDTQEIDMIEIL